MHRLSHSSMVRPYPGERLCGDAARVVEHGDGLLAVVSDGLGHGASAHAVSQIIMSWIGQQSSTDVSDLVTGLHARLRGTIGAAIGVAFVRHSDLTVRYVGVGNIVARILGGRSRVLMSRPGTLGLAMRSVLVQTDTLKIGDILLFHSDGVSSSFTLEDYPALLQDEPGIASAEILRRFGKNHDDASCIVMKVRDD